MFKQGMRVMFVNLVNVRQPPFLSGKLGQQLVPGESTFDVHWEGTMNIDTTLFEQYYDHIPVIMDGIDKEDEINIRAYVYEARMVSYGCGVRNALSFRPERTGNLLDASLERFGLRPVNHVVNKDAAARLIKEINKRTINRAPSSLIIIPIEIFNEIKSEAIPKMERAQVLENALRENPTLQVFVDKKELMENIPPLLRWAFNYGNEAIVPPADTPQPASKQPPSMMSDMPTTPTTTTTI
jgi:hypothetical protein